MSIKDTKQERTADAATEGLDNLDNMSEDELMQYARNLSFDEGSEGEEDAGSEDNPDEEIDDEEVGDTDGNVEEGEPTDYDDDDDSESDDGQSEEDEEGDEKPIVLKGKVTLKDRDTVIDIDDPDELIMLANKGLNYTGKTTELAKYRSFVKYAEEHGISIEDIQALADLKRGNVKAAEKIVKDAGIDPLDIDFDEEEGEYVPTTPPPVMDENVARVESIAEEILANPTEAEKFRRVVEHLPDDMKTQLATDPMALEGLRRDMSSPHFDEVFASAVKMQAVNGIPFNVAYQRAVEGIKEIESRTGKQGKMASSKAKEARPPRSGTTRGSGRSKTFDKVGVISDMDDDEFLEKYTEIVNHFKRKGK